MRIRAVDYTTRSSAYRERQKLIVTSNGAGILAIKALLCLSTAIRGSQAT